MNCTATITNTMPYTCGGEMEEIGKINNNELYKPKVLGGKGFLGIQTMYQCPICKTLKIV